MRHGIGVHGVNTGGNNADIGFIRAGERRDDAAEYFTVDFVFCAGCKRDVHIVAVASAFTNFILKTGVPGKERARGFMEGYLEDAALVVESELDAVTVVRIDIEVKDAASLLKKILDGDDDVV